MIKKILLCIIVLILLISSAFAVDLSEFPDMFIDNGNVNAVIIIGKAAKSEDSIGAIDIAVMLQNEVNNKVLNIAKLDNEIGTLSSYNSIIVGGPCANGAAAKLLDYPENCLEDFEFGQGYIRLFEWENGNVALLVAGAVALDTKRATRVLANYKDYDLKGNSVVVSRATLKDIRVTSIN